MKLNDETGLPGLREYLGMLANGIRDEYVRVNIRYYPDRRSTRFRGRAFDNQITIEIGRGITYPSQIVDRYMVRYKRLADLYENPRVATNVQELIGFIFIHELHHVRQFYKNRRAVMRGTPVKRKANFVRESDCTRWAYDHWKPMPPEMLHDGALAKLNAYSRAVKREQNRIAREAARNTPQAKLEVLQRNLKRVDTRMKRLATSRKKIERRIAYQQRQIAKRVQRETAPALATAVQALQQVMTQ